MPLAFTPLMKKRLTRRASEMIERSLRYFPELHGKTITVGLTRKHLGSASISYRAGAISRLVIRLRVRKVSYQTIGHELTHLVQGLAHGTGRRRARWRDPGFRREKSSATSGPWRGTHCNGVADLPETTTHRSRSMAALR